MRLILLFILSHFVVAPAAAEMLSGPVKVIDAANLRVGGQLVRLQGIAAPESGDRCPLRTVTIKCGRIATTALMDLTAGAKVQCETHGKPNAKGVYLATCKANGYDLSEGMVYTGWAEADGTQMSRYAAFELDARSAPRGMWRRN
ncbi:MAG: thermonuclease family protein [Rhodospirillaceae bacterium]|nr:thermonuclease family protein [Rhodospirillaceae bacterium]